ncbi:unnamed protein product [Linum trigynum]|uniref:Reverse transcriptase zinc-binding domain-containing protein n=1 Tax=Linum trigynum TaxID=586398 RepID=A0AAV2EE80_9ROSI
MGEDTTLWGIEKDVRFRLKSAYSHATRNLNDEPHKICKDMWKWRGPSRVKHFLWVVSHRRLLTNKEKERRGGSLTTANAHIAVEQKKQWNTSSKNATRIQDYGIVSG